MSRLLVVDDQESIAYSTQVLLKRAGYQVDACSDVDQALSLVNDTQYDVVLTDLRMDKLSGIELLRKVRSASPGTEVIIMTAFASIETAVEATKQGAFDYICKPYRRDDLLIRIDKAVERKKLMVELSWRRQDFRNRSGAERMIGTSGKLTALLNRAKTIGPSDCTVLITGETGTGKSLLASQIHAFSNRAQKPFVTVNCANLSEPLLESELFGVCKGAFTGAETSRPGLCETANQGTLFLDEIGVASMTVQSKLLTLLEDKTVRRLGDTRTTKVNLRIVAATNADLRELIRRHEFREDLYFRLNVASFAVPSLRDRKDDLSLLVDFFFQKFRAEYDKPIVGLTTGAFQKLAEYRFPGNIRELENVLQRAVVKCESEFIDMDDLDLEEECPCGSPSCDDRESIVKTIAENKFNVRKTADVLGVSRTTLYRRLHRFGIRAR